MKCNNTHIIEVPEGGEREQGIEKIVTETCPLSAGKKKKNKSREFNKI